MHANYVQQPGCSTELPGVETADAQIIHVKISSAGLWSQNESEFTNVMNDVPETKLMDKLEFANGYFLLPESARAQHNIRTANISISARHSYFGNRWQQLLINRFVGYDTILINSLLSSPGQVQLQHHARHQPPTFQLIFVHVIESLVFVPIMIGILFFLFEFYDDQLLAFMVLILVWLSELFTLISVRTPISMKFFPRFFLLYFLVFHIYFFSYAYGFSYLALSTAAAFMQHLILYFWNRFEVPTLQRFIQNRRSQLQQHPDFHITSSTFLASTLHITRLNTRNPGPVNSDTVSGPGLRSGSNPAVPSNGAEAPGFHERSGNENPVQNPLQVPGQTDLNQAENGPNPSTMNSFSSLLLWILGGASSEGLSSFLSMFRDVRDQGQAYAESPRQENQDGR